MYEPFELPVNYKNEVRMYPAQLVQMGYLHKFQVEIEDKIVLFEPDEEGNYRAVMPPSLTPDPTRLNIELYEAITKAIESVLK